MDCSHCTDLRDRLAVPTVNHPLPPGFLLIDGTDSKGHSYFRVPDSEVRACSCGCHDTWKWVNRR